MDGISKPFAFTCDRQWLQYLTESGLDIPFTDDRKVLSSPLSIGKWTAPNRILYQPMEGCDGTAEGSPDILTRRRYARFAAGGPGIIWLEAVAICESGRANPRQLRLKDSTLDDFKSLILSIKSTCLVEHGYEPLVILQLTHSGRYSKPEGKPAPIIAYNNPLFESTPIDPSCIISDDELQKLEETYAAAARLSELAGTDGVDIKCCHRYLASELLSAYTRPGRYGGSFENRTRFLRNAIAAAQGATRRVMVTTRLNLYDGFPYPYGFGVREEGGIDPDYTEGIRLAGLLHQKDGIPLINVTIGNPYVNPHVNRPSNTKLNLETEPPLIGVERILAASKVLKDAYPSLNVVCSGLSYLQQFIPMTAAAMVKEGRADLAGLGRAAFADPDIASAILRGEPLDRKQCCIACGKCSELMRAGTVAGCVIRDSEVYLPYYKKHVMHKEEA